MKRVFVKLRYYCRALSNCMPIINNNMFKCFWIGGIDMDDLETYTKK